MRKIEPVQIKMIHTAISTLGISDDAYRDILHCQYKAQSCTELNYVQASNLIDHFKTLGFKIKKNPSQSPFHPKGYETKKGRSYKNNSPFSKGGTRGILPANVVQLPSPDQLDLIDVLAGQITWKFEDGYLRWLAKYIKVSRITTAPQASRAIEGLKGMLANQNKDCHCEASLGRRGNLNEDNRG
jgi:hypothetical protein